MAIRVDGTAGREPGSAVDADIERVLARGNCWRVVGVHAVADEAATV
ncbi:hypothetical protein [Haloarcula halophila]|nr:hypothetical protein [Halomicroarcula sp. DFY41]